MKQFLLSLLLAFAFTLLAPAAPVSWAALETTAYTADASGGANKAQYSAYYCTYADAILLFGGTSVNAIEAYVKANFAEAQGRATTFDSVSYSDGEYHILDYVNAAFVSSDYVGYALYGSEGYRAYGAGSAVLTPGSQLVFNADTAEDGSVGIWSAVPEPTGGLLLLFGLAGLALRRKFR